MYRLNSATNEYVSVQPDSDLVPFKGGLDRQVPSRYRLTTDPSDPPLKVVIDAKAEPDQTSLMLQVIGSGYTAELRPTWPRGEVHNLTLYLAARPTGPELTFVANQDTVIPTLGIYLEDEVTTPPADVSAPEILEDNITQEVTTPVPQERQLQHGNRRHFPVRWPCSSLVCRPRPAAVLLCR